MLKLIKKTHKVGKNQLALYECGCGNTKELYMSNVKSGNSKDCGCSKRVGYKPNIIGKIYGYLTVYGLYKIGNRRYGECKCKCGNKIDVYWRDLSNSNVVSCGCALRDPTNKTTHGMTKTKIYSIYRRAKERCNSKSGKDYHNYGLRGIKFMWNSFIEFKKDMYQDYLLHKDKYDTTQLDRINNDGNYCKENCRWATCKEQSNNKRTNRYIEYKGETKTMIERSKYLGIKYSKISNRLNALGWSIDRCFTTP